MVSNRQSGTDSATIDYYGVGPTRASTQMEVQEPAYRPESIDITPKVGLKKLNRSDISTFLKDQRFADKK